jgi:membrane protein implicated in regulation of membrane protease activity
MVLLIRKSWFRICVIGFALVALNSCLPGADLATLREGASRALQATALIFAVCTALALAVLNNYVKGLKESSLKRITDIRSLVEKLYDEHKNSSDPDIQEIIREYLLPLLSFTTNHWLAFDPIKPTLEKIVEPGTRLHAKDGSVLPRYFLRLEDEINQLGILYIRRVIAGLHLRTIQGVFILVCVGIITIVAAFTLPSTPLANLVSINGSFAVIVFSVLELLLLMSYIAQEAEEETPDADGDPDEEEITQEM